MPTKHDYIRTEIADILDTVSGLTVLTSQTSGQEPARPYAMIKNVGWKKERDDNGEKLTAHASAIAMIEVYIAHAGGEEGLAEERNRLDDLIEHAFDSYQIADYADAHYECSGFIHEYQGASGVIDRNDNYGVFVATVSIDYLQTPITN